MYQDLIAKKIISKRPLFIGRFGSAEIKPVVARKFGLCGKIFEKKLLQPLSKNAGFFPKDLRLLRDYVDRMYADIEDLDILGSWRFEEKFLKKELSNVIQIPLPEIEPFRYASPWSKGLNNLNVLVIHPFSETILKQYERRDKIFENKDIIGNFSSLQVIKAVQSIGGQSSEFENWFDALKSMESKISKLEFDVAIIGAGAYGFCLGAHVKRLGKIAIHMGGATQLMFGIMGGRWGDDQQISALKNKHWVFPSSEETPEISNEIEGGCYW